jgi:hypothetical protein
MRHNLMGTLFLLAAGSVLFPFLAEHIADDPARFNRSYERGNETPRRLVAAREPLYRDIKQAEAKGRPDDARRLRAELAEVVRRTEEYLRESIRSAKE